MFLKNKQAGQTLVGAVMAAGLLGAFVVVSSDFGSKSIRAQKFLDMQGELEDLRNYLRNGMDCEKTSVDIGLMCKGKVFSDEFYVAVKNREGVDIVKKYQASRPESATNIAGEYGVRARCAEEGGVYDFSIEYRRQNGDGTVLKDPMTQDDSHWRTLFQLPRSCAGPRPPLHGHNTSAIRVFFEDTDGSKWKDKQEKDVKVCFSGEFKRSGTQFVTRSRQTVSFKTLGVSGCFDHTLTVSAIDRVYGYPVMEAVSFDSRDLKEFDIELPADALFQVSMQALNPRGCKSPLAPLRHLGSGSSWAEVTDTVWPNCN